MPTPPLDPTSTPQPDPASAPRPDPVSTRRTAAPSPEPWGDPDGTAPVLAAFDPARPSPFGRHGMVRAVVANPVTALLVQRALVMEVAHPAVAAGVEHHSRFRSHPLRRAWVTADAALRLTFGDDEVARGAVRQIYRVHDRINGPVEALGPVADPAPRPGSYTAHDAALLLWVWATLVDTAETAYTRWVRPFGPGEGEAFYTEMRSMGSFLGIPHDTLPADRAAFARYLERTLDDERLGSSEVSRRVARQVLWFSHWSVPPAAVWLQTRAGVRHARPPGRAPTGPAARPGRHRSGAPPRPLAVLPLPPPAPDPGPAAGALRAAATPEHRARRAAAGAALRPPVGKAAVGPQEGAVPPRA